MSQAEKKEMARIRHELRERLMSERVDGVNEVLASLRRYADREDDGISDLRREYERWRLRFQLLAWGDRA